MSDAPTPGWYPDPAGGGALRWWDGAGWTSHTFDLPPPPTQRATEAPTEPATPAASQPATPRRWTPTPPPPVTAEPPDVKPPVRYPVRIVVGLGIACILGAIALLVVMTRTADDRSGKGDQASQTAGGTEATESTTTAASSPSSSAPTPTPTTYTDVNGVYELDIGSDWVPLTSSPTANPQWRLRDGSTVNIVVQQVPASLSLEEVVKADIDGLSANSGVTVGSSTTTTLADGTPAQLIRYTNAMFGTPLPAEVLIVVKDGYSIAVTVTVPPGGNSDSTFAAVDPYLRSVRVLR